MGVIKDRIGQRFGMLLVKELTEKRNPDRSCIYRCLCDCGRETIVSSNHLKTGHTKSCGCLRATTLVKMRTTHGKSHQRLFRIFYGMKQRCGNSNSRLYKYYGGKGVSVLWKNFQEFLDDMEVSYYEHVDMYGEKDTTIDRIDSDGSYCLENCRWATMKVQQNNKKKILK